MFTQADIDAKIRALYPGGISGHGFNHLYRYNDLHIHNGFVDGNHAVETSFELMRMLKFPDLPSRFQAYFGCETLAESLEFSESQNDPCTVYLVECENAVKVDMNWLTTACSIPGNIAAAECYCRGEPSDQPFWEILMIPPVQIIEEISVEKLPEP